jgi:hypothetical protein
MKRTSNIGEPGLTGLLPPTVSTAPYPDADVEKRLSILEGEIETATHHAEVVRWTVHYVPAEIINPAEMRRDSDFNAATELANPLCLGIGTACDDLIVHFAFLLR